MSKEPSRRQWLLGLVGACLGAPARGRATAPRGTPGAGASAAPAPPTVTYKAVLPSRCRIGFVPTADISVQERRPW